MIGDREHDVRAARRTGVHSIGVLYGFGSRAELEGAGAEGICARVEDLPATIASFS
jgi:phosphoglycolate phosphatase